MIYKLTKFHKEILVGFGTRIFNPTKTSENRIPFSSCSSVWICYDGTWYLTNEKQIIPLINDLKNNTYNISQLEEKIINIMAN